MKAFSQNISLSRNARGCYILDTVKGCSVCANEKPRGCYGNCYAKNIADRYGLDFGHPVSRDFYKNAKQIMMYGFEDETHIAQIRKQIKQARMPFIRIGEMGDPSESWEQTISVCALIASAGKPIVIITKHWKPIPDYLLPMLATLRLTINTSISALDDEYEISHRLGQYNRLKPYCNSVLRIVSCNFNKKNDEGVFRHCIQEELFANEKIIDTVFRPDKNNRFIAEGIIKTDKIPFMGSMVLGSVNNAQVYTGYCDTCPDMCGIAQS